MLDGIGPVKLLNIKSSPLLQVFLVLFIGWYIYRAVKKHIEHQVRRLAFLYLT